MNGFAVCNTPHHIVYNNCINTNRKRVRSDDIDFQKKKTDKFASLKIFIHSYKNEVSSCFDLRDTGDHYTEEPPQPVWSDFSASLSCAARGLGDRIWQRRKRKCRKLEKAVVSGKMCLWIDDCNFEKESYVRQQAWNSNQHITLPSIALVNLTPRYTIACPGYTLVGNPIPSSSLSLVIRYNSSFLMNNISIVNVYKHLHENTSWFNTKPSDKRIDNIIKRMRESMANPPNELYYPTHTRFSNASIVNWILLALVSGVVAYYIYQHKQKTILGSI
ncbi:unnamed protein product [Adineta ricciae]|uniref:Uncharacterized protein n=1 Tax=Adineta ricciae TaxID=249248 RepID=A0A815RRV1_ADIRI|nr:unnamed protein product [Adineta ricciae]